jgi:4-hydroxy-2-oxoheptanedioate aldolase
LTGFRSRLHEPGPLFWSILMIPEPAVAAILGFSGVDWVMVDAEHGPFTLSSLRACMTSFKTTPASVVVRTASANKVELQQYADLGVDGVLAPHIDNAEEAEAVVSAVRYPPEGGRGVGEGMLSTGYGHEEAAYLERANSAVAAMVIIESRAGLESVEEIAAVPGLDALVVGSADLAGDLGVPGEYDHPTVLEAMDRVTECALAAGLKVFARPKPRSAAEHDAGLVLCATDAIALTGAATAACEDARAGWSIPADAVEAD